MKTPVKPISHQIDKLDHEWEAFSGIYGSITKRCSRCGLKVVLMFGSSNAYWVCYENGDIPIPESCKAYRMSEALS